MPGPKIDRPRRVSAARIRVSASDDRRRVVQEGGELAEDSRADADDHRQRQNLDAAGDDVAEHLLGEKRGAAEESEGHEHEAGERRQLELDQADEELDRHDEEADHDNQPGDQQDGDLEKLSKKLVKPISPEIEVKIGLPESMPT